MRKLFKHLKPYAATIAAIVVILIVQAYCDLSLPSYTSDIVNVGIQQGGIDEKIPDAIAEEEMNKLLLFVAEEDQQTVLDAYEKKESDSDYKYDGAIYVLKDSVKKDEEKSGKVFDILGKPMLLTYGFESGSDTTKKMEESMKENMISSIKEQAEKQAESMQSQMTDEQKAALAANPELAKKQQDEMQKNIDEQVKKIENADIFEILNMIPDEQRADVIDKISEKMDDMPDTMLEQSATSYIKETYSVLGVNTDKIQNRYILTTGGKMLALAFLGMLASVTVGLLASRVAASTGRDLRGKVFKKVVGFSNAEFDKFSTASLITRSTNDIQQIQLLIVMILRMVLYAPIMAIGGIWKVFHTNVSMSWIIGLAVAVIVVIVAFLFFVVMPKFKLIQNQVDRLNLVSREILTGLSVIRAFSREKFEEKRFDEANRNLMKTQLFTNRVMTFMMPAMMLIMNCVTVMIVWFGAKGIDAGNLQVGDMMAFMTYTMQIVMSFLMITMVSVMLPRAGVAADRIEEILRTDSSIVDAKKTEDEKLTQCRGELRFEDVSFKYPGAEGDVLEHISFTAKPGQTTAVIGSTGCGKSTLIQLIPRFYDVTEGKITLDGVDIRNLSQHKLREVMGLVPQKGVLFSGTIASNIKLAGEDEISDETMKEAAQTAQATEFIDAKPEGYDSPVAQGGSNVSGGQKQRLAIARVIAKHPKVYLFDDSFSALDYKTDAALRKALHEQAADATVLIVAQRISTIMNAEQILVLEDGKIVGKGTHEELMKNCSAYQEIARSQLSESELKGGMAE